MRKLKPLGFFVLTMMILSCQDDENNLSSVEDRTKEAIEELMDELTEPSNGWRLDYQPAPDAGLFYILLNFADNGMVTIKSDVPDNNGDFFEQTIPYRIDNALELELILETYAVFHYMFEQDQSTFGGEFEFLFKDKEGSNLVFESKSDVSDKTQLVFTPAAVNADESFSRDISSNLNLFDDLTPQIFGGEPPVQQLFLNEQNISIFWSIDIAKRSIQVDLAGVGATIEEVVENTDNLMVNHSTGYIILDGKLILVEPFSISLRGEQVTISEVRLTDFSMNDQSFCELNPTSTAVYNGEISGVSSVVLSKSMFNSSGLGFEPMTESPYSVNVIFIFDEEAISLAQEGSISEKFPDATGFVFNYGLISTSEPGNAVGFILEDESGELKTYLREFEISSTIGNRLQINLLNTFYYSESPEMGEEQSLIEVTDEIFEGGTVYISDLPTDGTEIFRVFNPCNFYELFLVQ